MKYYQFVLWIIGGVLQVMVLAALIRGAFRKFPFLFAFCIILFLTTVVEIAATTEVGLLNYTYYYYDEILRQTGILAIVVSLILKSTPPGPKRAPFARMVIAGAILFWLVSLWACHNERVGHWMNALDRNLSFGSAILNLLLWSRLMVYRSRDRQILLISSGLGLQMAGQAIGMSLIALSRDYYFTGSNIAVFSSFLCSFVWWRALRRTPAVEATRTALPPIDRTAPKRNAAGSSSSETETGS